MAFLAHGTGPRHLHFAHGAVFKRWWFWAIVVVILLVIVSVIWVAVHALKAKAELETSQSLVSKLKSQAGAQDFAGVGDTMSALAKHAAAAQDLTSDFVWRAGELVPVLGKNLSVVRELAAVTNGVVTDAVSPLADVASALDAKSFAPVDGAINIEPLTKAIPAVDKADAAIAGAQKAIRAIDTDGTVSALPAAKAKLAGLLESAAPLLHTAKTILPILPTTLGSEKPRNYVVMFQNNAEARALGGTALSFALVTMDKGHIALTSTVSAGQGHFAHYADSVVPVPDGAFEIYADGFGTFIANATVRPSFTTAAEVTHEMWKRQFGTDVDGIISIDPVALSYILRATTPISLTSGDTLTSDTLVPLLLNEVYQRYNTNNIINDNAHQDAIYGEAVAATFARLSSGPLDPKLLLGAMMQGWSERRVMYWSSHPDEEKRLDAIGFAAGLPKSDKTADRVGVYFQDAIGSKMDYYLNQSVNLSQAVCRADGRANYRVTVDLTNTAPANALTALSPSIMGTWKHEGVKPGNQRMIVMLYAPPGSQIVGATVSGIPVALEALHDTDYPVAKVLVNFAPGATQSLTFDVVPAKAGKRALEAQITPMVHPTAVTQGPLDCSTVAVK